MPTEIRRLTAHDAEPYYALRMRTLSENPETFLITPDEEAGLDETRARLARTEPRDDDVIFGAWDGSTLIGTAGMFRQTPNRVRGRHRAMIWGMYVTPETRGHGTGRRLLDAAIHAARNAEGIELIHLGVVPENKPARRLYRNAGFEPWGIETKSSKIEGRYVDTEMMVLFL